MLRLSSSLRVLILLVVVLLQCSMEVRAASNDDDVQTSDTSSTSCKFTSSDGSKRYDITPLSRVSTELPTLKANWYDIEYGSANSKRDNYTYYINVCHSLLNFESTDNAPVGVLQVVDGTMSNTESYACGSSEGTLQSLHDGDLRYVYTPSSAGASSSCTKGRKSVLLLNCEDVGLGTPNFVDEMEGCSYFFVWNTCAACPLGSEIRNNCPDFTRDGCKLPASVGTVLVVTFFVCFGIYIIVGVLYNRFVKGEKGLEQFPNIDFWMDICENIYEGFRFVFKFSSSKPRPHAVTYKGFEDHEDVDVDAELDEDLYGLEEGKTSSS